MGENIGSKEDGRGKHSWTGSESGADIETARGRVHVGPSASGIFSTDQTRAKTKTNACYRNFRLHETTDESHQIAHDSKHRAEVVVGGVAPAQAERGKRRQPAKKGGGEGVVYSSLITNAVRAKHGRIAAAFCLILAARRGEQPAARVESANGRPPFS